MTDIQPPQENIDRMDSADGGKEKHIMIIGAVERRGKKDEYKDIRRTVRYIGDLRTAVLPRKANIYAVIGSTDRWITSIRTA